MNNIKIAVNQPNYLPWLGYFDLLDSVDRFIFLDDVEYSRNSVISRNKISNASGNTRWLSLSLHKSSFHDTINQKKLVNGCLIDHLNLMSSYYGSSPYFTDVFGFVHALVGENQSDLLSNVNMNIIIAICDLIGIECDFFVSSHVSQCSRFKSTQKIFCLIDQYDYQEYYNFSKGVDIGLYDKEIFSEKGKLLFKQAYQHPVYSRPNFQPYMSIIDLLFYELPNALEIIRSGRNWTLTNSETL